MKRFASCLFTLAFLQSALGLQILNYTPEANLRFSSGFGTLPVANESPSFLGANFDFSGVGWVGTFGYPEGSFPPRVRNVPMISPVHMPLAKHYSPAVGDTVSFLNSEGDLLTRSVQSVVSTFPTLTLNNDLAVGRLSSPFAEADAVAVARLMDFSGPNITSSSVPVLPMFIYGSQPGGAGPRIANGRATSISTNTILSLPPGNATNDFITAESGDSGSPGYFRYDAPGSTPEELVLAGFFWVTNGLGSLVPTSTFPLTRPVNDQMAADGYALKFTIYDDPADAERTAPRWTGGSLNGNFSDAGNWSSATVPDAVSLVFDAAATNNQFTVNVDSSRAVRGILFTASATPGGFEISGNGTLQLGYTGLRNQSTETQTLSTTIQLTDSQNWEAESGDLVVNGNVTTTQTLQVLSIGGSENTTLNGVVSGNGTLAKEGSGTLIVGAQNTYMGKTFLHEGTIRLQPGGALSNRELVFTTRDQATLDLNGQNQTLADTYSLPNANGRILLGGGNLTIQTTTNSAQIYRGSLEETGLVVKSGTGLWSFGGNAGFSGTLRLDAGVLRLTAVQATPSLANTVFNGGVLELGAADLSPTLGAGVGAFQWQGSGGFSARDGTRRVNVGGAGQSLAWEQSYFVSRNHSLILSSGQSNATLEWMNPLDLTGGNRTVFVNNGSAPVDARMLGTIGNGTLIKDGAGVLQLSGGSTISALEVKGGTLSAMSDAELGAGNTLLSGGSLLLAGDNIVRALGTGAGQIRLTAGNSGFAAGGMDRTVNLGGSGATLTWGTSTFNPAIFQLSSDAANAMVDIQNGINLNGSRVVQVANGTARVDARLSGNITGNGNFEKRGAGALELTGNNSWSGLTIVDSGQLILSSANALPGGNLRMVNAAILVLNQGDFSRSVGNGTNQIEFQQVVNLGSGFGARGADRVVNLGGNGETLTWNSGLFLQNSQRLYLSSDASDAMVDFQNALNLNGQTQTVWVNNGAGVVDGRISGQISNGGLTKLGDGLLELTATNTYTGVTQQAGGTLRLGLNSISAQSNLTILRGAVELVGGGNFTRSLGSGAGQVRFTGSDSPAGFSAKGGDLTISFNGNSNELIWNNTSGFLANIGLLLGAESADSTTILTNALSLGPANQTIIREIQSMNGSADVDARLTGNVTSANGTNQGLRKTGTGTLETTGVLSYTGATFVDAGELRVSGSITNTSGISVASEARFHYAGATSLNRSVSVEGGSFIYNSAAAFTGNLNLTEGTLGGSGNLTGTSLTIGQGIQISPGNSSGTLITGSQTWQNGGTYVWEIKDLNGTAGAPVGWDLLSLSGTLSLTELTDHFTIQVVANTLAGWNPNLQQDWLILTASGISDFDANRFQMDTSSFQETLNGNFAVDASNNTLLLTYTPVPEPGTLMLAIFAAALIGMGRLRHGKKQIV